MFQESNDAKICNVMEIQNLWNFFFFFIASVIFFCQIDALGGMIQQTGATCSCGGSKFSHGPFSAFQTCAKDSKALHCQSMMTNLRNRHVQVCTMRGIIYIFVFFQPSAASYSVWLFKHHSYIFIYMMLFFFLYFFFVLYLGSVWLAGICVGREDCSFREVFSIYAKDHFSQKL